MLRGGSSRHRDAGSADARELLGVVEPRIDGTYDVLPGWDALREEGAQKGVTIDPVSVAARACPASTRRAGPACACATAGVRGSGNPVRAIAVRAECGRATELPAAFRALELSSCGCGCACLSLCRGCLRALSWPCHQFTSSCWRSE